MSARCCALLIWWAPRHFGTRPAVTLCRSPGHRITGSVPRPRSPSDQRPPSRNGGYSPGLWQDRRPRRVIGEDRHATADHHDRERAESPLYSQRVKVGPDVLVSGIVRIDPGTGSLAGDTIQDQTRKALANCQAILQAGGASLDDVIEVGVLLTNPADSAGLNEEYARWFPSRPPTRYVAKLGVELPGLLVSIRMAAFIT